MCVFEFYKQLRGLDYFLHQETQAGRTNLEDGEASLDGALQHRSVHDVKGETLLGEVLGRPVSLLDARVSKSYVDPPGEAVLLVPRALSVPHEHKGVVTVGVEAIVTLTPAKADETGRQTGFLSAAIADNSWPV